MSYSQIYRYVCVRVKSKEDLCCKVGDTCSAYLKGNNLLATPPFPFMIFDLI